METFVTDKLFGKLDRQALESPLAKTQKRLISNYGQTDRWGTFSSGLSSNRPSAICNPFARDILLLKRQYEENLQLSDQVQSVYTTDHMWQTLITRGVEVSNAVHRGILNEAPGMKCIRQMMHCIEKLVELENTKLEPFQLETMRACICSSAVRLLGEDLTKHIPSILEVTGIAEREGYENSDLNSADQLKALEEIFFSYARRFVAVIAPRRNGKSKAGKYFVAANSVSEPGARIVLVAHQLNAVMLYKSEILKHLNQMLEIGLARYKIHSSASEIRIEFHDKPPSHIYFVAGGINVSI